ncbi:hypothetical protein [Photobacterium profundum]|uniref:hypothetical protein n=1 Tax=Photobacterium profundum TaxID=74109 RepID=UPI0003134E99|nr:hypothetical protein [Photobacterium profundum]
MNEHYSIPQTSFFYTSDRNSKRTKQVMTQSVEKLQESAASVRKLVTTVREISEQTNLLALAPQLLKSTI